MSDQDLFNTEAPKPTEPVVNGTPQDQLATLLASIKDESGRQKYASIDKALEALNHSQMFIPQLKTDLELERSKRIEAEGRLKSQADLEAALEQLAARQSERGSESQPVIPSGIDEQKVQDIVRQFVEGKEALTRAEQNRAMVVKELDQKFGDKAREAIEAKAAELGMTPDQLGRMATETPKAVLAFFSTGVKTPTSSTPPPSLNIHGMPKDEKLPEKVTGMLGGVSNKTQGELMRKIREEVEKEFGVTR